MTSLPEAKSLGGVRQDAAPPEVGHMFQTAKPPNHPTIHGERWVRFLFVEKPVIASTPPCRLAATSPLPEGGIY